ncbi:MAG: endolytic transglycosylase MltG, partial [Bryobacteraceae bacterium]|nr:endolytic transglycosylase MltG [Bryobacteraceae bacterium]
MIKRLFLMFLLILLLAAGGLWYKLHMPYKGFSSEVLLDISPGTSTSGMAKLLHNAGVIQSEWEFLVVRALHSGTKLQAGEYKFDRALPVTDVYSKIARGDVFYYELRVPEGSTIFEIAEEVGKLRFLSSKEFLKEARNPSLIRDLAPAALSLEGYLFPSTYRITKRTSVRQICREMTSQFRKVWTQIGG